MAQPFVSVVTPFHNTGAYLRECIESVLSQRYENFEYILVDNLSTDDSWAIADEYARRDGRIRLIKRDTLLPQVPNYNFALSLISPSSVYTKMIQADDRLYPQCLPEMVALAAEQPTVGMVSAYRLSEAAVECTGLHADQTVVSGKEACRMHLRAQAYLFGSPSTVLYRSDIIRARTPFFREGRFHEDTEAAFEILTAHDLGFVHQILTFSRRNADSIMGSVRDFFPHILDRLIITLVYGQQFLEPDEYAACLNDTQKEYYYRLASRWVADGFRFKNEPFWDYHRRGLATVGEAIRMPLLVRHAADMLVRRALSPIEMARELRESLLKKRS
jgi:glycosyltransferase involved in cell wall biosynthesis